VTDASGALKARYDYDPYGKSVVVDGNMNVDFGYTGHYFHAPSGLNLTLYRAYNPALGRWLSRDPIGENGGTNLYGYVFNSPVKLVDPLGLEVPNSWFDENEYGRAVMGSQGGIDNLANQAPKIMQDTAREGLTDVAMAVVPELGLWERFLSWFRWGKKCEVAYDYHPRIRAGGVEGGVGHNFPYSFDSAILRTKPVIQADGSLLYRMPGTINETSGVFEIAVNPTTRTIFHRVFRGN
jgi:RHS repeat-associated protein